MFPDKIDKAVLDGVVNAHEYYHMYVVLCFCSETMVMRSSV